MVPAVVRSVPLCAALLDAALPQQHRRPELPPPVAWNALLHDDGPHPIGTLGVPTVAFDPTTPTGASATDAPSASGTARRRP
jgi:hypothetical protein